MFKEMTRVVHDCNDDADYYCRALVEGEDDELEWGICSTGMEEPVADFDADCIFDIDFCPLCGIELADTLSEVTGVDAASYTVDKVLVEVEGCVG